MLLIQKKEGMSDGVQAFNCNTAQRQKSKRFIPITAFSSPYGQPCPRHLGKAHWNESKDRIQVHTGRSYLGSWLVQRRKWYATMRR